MNFRIFFQSKFFFYIVTVASVYNVNAQDTSKTLAIQTKNIISRYVIKTQSDKDYLAFQLSEVPTYEIIENLKERVLTVKFKNTILPEFFNQKSFPTPFIRFIKFLVVSESEVWVMIKVSTPDLLYKILPLAHRKALGIEFTVKSPERKKPITNQITQVEIQSKEGEAEAILIYFNEKPRVKSNKINLPTPHYEIEFDAEPVPGIQMPLIHRSALLKPIVFKKNETGSYLTVEALSGDLNLQYKYFPNPNRIILQLRRSGFPDQIEDNDLKVFFEDEKFAAKNKNIDQKMKQEFARAEYLYRNGKWEQAATKFRQIYFMFPNERLGVRSLFRAADAYDHRNQEANAKNSGEGFLFVTQEYIKAINAAKELGIVSADLEAAYFNIARNYHQALYYDVAWQYYLELLERFPTSPYAPAAKFHSAVLLMEKKQYRKIITQLEAFREEYPENRYFPPSLYQSGRAHYELKEYDKARLLFDQARNMSTAISKKNPDLLFVIGETYFFTKEYDKARATYEDILDLYPDHELVNYVALRLGDYYRDKGEESLAISTYGLLLPRSPVEMSLLGRMRIANMLVERLNDEDYKLAVNLYDFVLRSNPELPIAEEATLRKGLAYDMHKQNIEAIKALEKFEQFYPNNEFVKNKTSVRLIIQNWNNLAAEEYAKGNLEKVVSIYAKNKKLFQDEANISSFYLYAQAYNQLGLFSEAINLYQLELLLENPMRRGLAYWELGNIYLQQRKHAQATGAFENFLSQTPENIYTPMVMKALGDSYSSANRMPEAIASYKQVLEKYKDSGNPLVFDTYGATWFALAELYRELGNFREALPSFQNILNSYKYSFQDKEILPYIITTFYRIGDMHLELERLDEAKEAYQRALSLYPKAEQAPWGEYQIGFIYQKQGKFDLATQVYDDLIQQAGANPQQLWALLAIEGKKEIQNNQAFNNYLKNGES